ncbi:MAG: hypothetical protein LHW56_01225 [Candidatus Cloacimonetes bacterium]|nr:hypothetical protein [Candidatus Cloacimonadota bacterium]MDY0171507.1 hypothetical protein [Candidatus Cloacimonadaceae bacterium]
MTKQQYIDKGVRQLLECDSDLVVQTAIIVIDSTKKLTYENTDQVISLSHQIDILSEIRKRLTATSVIKEAQESGCLMQSVGNVLDYLKPAASAMQNEIDTLSQSEKSTKEEKPIKSK